jgi:hypothetical protein
MKALPFRRPLFKGHFEMEKTRGNSMGILWLIAFIVVWILLQAFVLPKLGVST